MNIVMNVFNWLIAAGPTVLLPVIITIIGMIFGLRIDKAFKSGLTLGIGFAGIKLISVSYTHLRAHETEADLVCRLLLEKKKKKKK
ncbi:putative PTS system galactitol-specific IIC component [Lactobacillus rhamnosus GG] [Lacticaseibacillus rhamnosus]|nr:putative PTS system galactitol-specific IIC component [Lactobacillus rhamnosus GG] [Lacticaseibacillus rhamnosus]